MFVNNLRFSKNIFSSKLRGLCIKSNNNQNKMLKNMNDKLKMTDIDNYKYKHEHEQEHEHNHKYDKKKYNFIGIAVVTAFAVLFEPVCYRIYYEMYVKPKPR